MRVKNVSGQDLIVPEVRDEPVAADEIVEVPTDLGRRMAKNTAAWKITSRDKGEEEEGED